MKRPRTIRELIDSGYKPRSVKDEIRDNLIERLRRGKKIFSGIVGYEDTVVPQIVNAILSRHNLILLGLRGQAKSRIVRSLLVLLDDAIPVMKGCEIHDDPLQPSCKACCQRVGQEGESAEIGFLPRDRRYVEKLATPDVTIADMIGDIDPIKAAKRGLNLSDELTVHFGLLPRANRGLFAINELPDLAPKIQVGLFNIMEERDVQIRGYPVRLPLDVFLVFTANPEDYTARGKIITPLKDRIGSEIRTHYPANLEEGMQITAQEAWTCRGSDGLFAMPPFIREIVEEIAFCAREHPLVDKQSGISQRVPITCLENVVSNAERRAALMKIPRVIPRVSDIYFAIPSLTGKLELEYEGQIKGSEKIARELIRSAISRVFRRYLQVGECKEIIEWFEGGNELRLPQEMKSRESLIALKRIPGLMGQCDRLLLGAKPTAELKISAAELVLEGLYALKKIHRIEERAGIQYGAVGKRAGSRPMVN